MNAEPNPFRTRPSQQDGDGALPPAGGPAFNVPPITLLFLAAIGAVFLLLQIGGQTLHQWILINGSVIPIRFAAAFRQPGSAEFWATLPSLLTHALIHRDGLHILANAGFLLAFGSMAERMLGRPRFVLLIVASAIGGAAAQLLASWGEFSVMFGASGVVSGCIGAVLATMVITSGPGSARRRFAFNLAFILIAANLVIGLGGQWLTANGATIAWQAHIGGFVVGFFLPFVTLRR